MSDLNKNAAADFFSAQDEEQKRMQQNSMDGASSEERAPRIGFPGRYMCEVATFAYKEKDSGKIKVYPEIFISDTKHSLNMTLSLRTVEATPKVPKGSTIFTNIVLCPNSKVQSDIDNVMRFTKPRLVALTGNEKIILSQDWINDNLMPKYELKGKELVLVKDHKMKNKVMVLVDEDLGKDGKIRLVAKSISKVVPGDKSETFEVEKSASNVNVPPVPSDNVSDIAFESGVDVGAGAEPNVSPDLPETEPF